MLPIGIDTPFWQSLHYNNIFILVLELLLAGGWIFIFYALWPIIKEDWINWRQGIFAQENPNVLMELRIPENNTGNIEAVEQVLAHLHGLRRSPSLWEILWKGQYVLKISLEIVSFGGHIKFYVRSAYKHMHAMQHALQAQYPEIEFKILKEEEDFVRMFPDTMPHKEYNMLGTEYVLHKPQYFPIKTYKEYEKLQTGECLDPMRHLFEMMSHLREGEYVWYQLILVPEDETRALGWKKEVNKLLGKEVENKQKSKSIAKIFAENLFSIIKHILLVPVSIIKEVIRQVASGTGSIIFSQVKDNTYQEVGSQLKGVGKEFIGQVACIHNALFEQLGRKKKKAPFPQEAGRSEPVVVNNEINVHPNVTVNAHGTEFPSDYIFRSDKQKKVIDAIERKLSKQMYKTCLRVLYFGKHPVYSKFRFWAEMHGFFRHFNDIDYNVWTRGLYTKTTANYFFARIRKKRRQKSIIANAKARDGYAGDICNFLSVEELASLWHLPASQNLQASIETVSWPAKSPPKPLRGRAGYNKDRLKDISKGPVPDNLPVEEYLPFNYK